MKYLLDDSRPTKPWRNTKKLDCVLEVSELLLIAGKHKFNNDMHVEANLVRLLVNYVRRYNIRQCEVAVERQKQIPP